MYSSQHHNVVAVAVADESVALKSVMKGSPSNMTVNQKFIVM